MIESLVIVESPAKGKTIKKYLGKGFEVLASYGHVRDLIPKDGAIDTENDFAMKYESIQRNEKHVANIIKALKTAKNLYLATDPDREGEAIAWHLQELLKEKKKLDGIKVQRVVFHEITKSAVQNAIQNPRELSIPLVDAQLARRALDYLVGFNLSPLLWKKIKYGLSAGRVQSPALRLIAEREEEIEAFKPVEYWTLTANVEKNQHPFIAKLHTLDGKALKQFDINTEALATAAKTKLLAASKGHLTVTAVNKRERKRQPTAPFTTSTLQQEAAGKLRFTTQHTMSVAQKLYEGIDLGNGPIGLITYMRTDSVALAGEAVAEIRDVIGEKFGKDYLNPEVRTYKTKSKNAQEAHEAIRPTSAHHIPSEIKPYLKEEQFKLYNLIWKRTVACQMIHATLNTVSVNLSANDDSFFRASGSSIKHAGFMKVHQEGNSLPADDKEKLLPPMEVDEKIKLNEIIDKQHFTEPPPRYTEASLVKTLEEYGIGRPSTYASIISTLQYREYVELESRRFFPTDIGKIVNRFLTQHFTQYVDYDFTAKLEDDLDVIARGEKDWVPLMKEFWSPFHELVEEKDVSVSRDEVLQARELGTDPKSGKPVSVRMGRFGPYVQIGTRDDEDKPKFAGLQTGQKMDQITFEEAMYLFNLPRDLGVSPDGEKISTNIGRFGPYVKYDSKFVSLKKEDDPYTVTLERALELVAEKKVIDANRIIHVWEEEGIQILNGRWGPYITDGNKNARVAKDVDAKALTLEECQELIAKAPEKKKRGKKVAPKKKAVAKKKPATKRKAPVKRKAPAKKPAAKKAVTKKAPAKKPAVKKTVTKKAPAKKPAIKKTVTKKAPAKKPAVKKTVTKKAPAKKPAVKKAVTKKAPAKKPAAKKKPSETDSEE
ncbi:MAG: DNA topoisomerase I [Thiotrichaceae bacterium]|nr:DNA topoisomerase I [Thiotrichaceae bacterium]